MSPYYITHLCLKSAAVLSESCQTDDWVMLHRRLSHVTHMIESCHTDEWAEGSGLSSMSESRHTWTSHFTHVNESCHTCWWAKLHVCDMIQPAEDSCVWHDSWLISHTSMSHVTLVDESCHTHASSAGWVMSHTWSSAHIYVELSDTQLAEFLWQSCIFQIGLFW